MNTQRAKDIAESAAMAYVTYEGVPIYIQHVNEDKETARIFRSEILNLSRKCCFLIYKSIFEKRSADQSRPFMFL